MLGHQRRFAAEWTERGLWGNQRIPDALLATATRRPDQVAIIDGDNRTTFAELARRSTALARALHSLGIQPGETVAYQLPNWTETIVTAHAISAHGAIANPILPAYGERETRFILRESRAHALFIPGRYRRVDHRLRIRGLRRELPDLAHVVVVRDSAGPEMLEFATLEGSVGAAPRDDARTAASGHGGAAPWADANAIAFLVYTSGTTADPKGVLHTHNTLLAETRSLECVHGFTHQDTVLMPLPLTHISGVIHAVLVPAVLGTTAVLMDRWDANRAHDLLAQARVTYMVGPPVFVQELCSVQRPQPPALRLVSCGGADVTPAIVRMAETQLGCTAKRVYGSTEFPTLTTTGPDDPPERRHDTEGRVIGAAELRIVADDDTDCPRGTEGEILARGPECCVGYRNAALDAESFDASGWFRTGDLGVLDAAGYLRITGRKKDIIIRKGENISAREVEDLLAGHPDVNEVAVVGIPDPETGERVCAVVCPRPGTKPTLEALARFLDEAGLSTRKLPEGLELVSEFPRTASGKVHKPALRRQLLSLSRS